MHFKLLFFTLCGIVILGCESNSTITLRDVGGDINLDSGINDGGDEDVATSCQTNTDCENVGGWCKLERCVPFAQDGEACNEDGLEIAERELCADDFTCLQEDSTDDASPKFCRKDCLTIDDCGGTGWCRSNFCRPFLSAGTNCEFDSIENQERCQPGFACLGDQNDESVPRTCQEGCEFDSQCEDGWCRERTCTPYVGVGAGCGGFFIGSVERCDPDENICAEANPFEIDDLGFCGAACTDDEDCVGDFVCRNEVCIEGGLGGGDCDLGGFGGPGGPGGPALEECAPGYACRRNISGQSEGKCREVCRDDSDCLDVGFCDAQFCELETCDLGLCNTYTPFGGSCTQGGVGGIYNQACEENITNRCEAGLTCISLNPIPNEPSNEDCPQIDRESFCSQPCGDGLPDCPTDYSCQTVDDGVTTAGEYCVPVL